MTGVLSIITQIAQMLNLGTLDSIITFVKKIIELVSSVNSSKTVTTAQA